MSLDVNLIAVRKVSVFDCNITHNLGEMADKAGLYKALWHPEELQIKRADELILVLKQGLKKLKRNPLFYKRYNAKNGWGKYEHLVEFVEKYLQACIDNPDAEVGVSI
jgi:hypothetical protein